MSTKENRLEFFDILRGIAALVVMIGHARWLLWEGYFNGFLKHPEAYGFFEKFVMYGMSIFKFGHEMVMLFFVMSGFLIHYGFSRKILNGSTQFNLTYFKKRVLRIYPVFIISLLITYALDKIGLYLSLPIYTGATNNTIIDESIQINLGLDNLIDNFFLIGSEVWGSNGPIWSLKLEWCFYLIYPLFYLINKNCIELSYLIFPCVAMFLSNYEFEGFNGFFGSVVKSFPIWLMGAYLADVVTGRIRFNLKYLQLFILSFFILLFSNFKLNILNDYLVAVGFVGFISILIIITQKNYIILDNKVLIFMSKISYSLYVVHFPFLVLMSALLHKYFGGTLPQNQIFIFVGIVICLCVSYVVYNLIERPSMIIKQAINK